MSNGSSRQHFHGVQDVRIDQRISVPPPLVVSVFRAVASLLEDVRVPAPAPASRKRRQPEMLYLSDVRGANSGLELLAHFSGVDRGVWVGAATVGPVQGLTFHDDGVRDALLSAI